MTGWRRAAVALAALTLAACPLGCAGTPHVAGVGSDAPPTDGLHTPDPPFTADEIRAATGVGRTYVQRTSSGGQPPVRSTFRFVAVDAEGAMLEVAGSAGGAPTRHRLTWAELASHGRQPPGAVRSEASCEVPAGRFDCITYEAVVGGARTRTSFARSLPGMPIRVERADGDGWVSVMVLEAHRPGELP